MNLDPGSGRATPDSSGRVSPIPRQWRNQLNSDDHPVAKDKAFRRYAAIVDKALTVFEISLEEWADYISFLNRLLKALQARQSTMTAVPSRALVSQRLAQCLNPQLPSGVHQKALEVYSYIFDMIGTEGLARDLLLYLPGLANTLSFGSLSVRSMYLDILERYFLGLPLDRLRPATRSIILGLLPGLEDETSEDFDRIVKLMERFKAAIRLPGDDEEFVPSNAPGDSFFWQVFFLASITGNNRRPGALAYMVRALPKLSGTLDFGDYTSNEDPGQIPTKLENMVTRPEPGLLLRAFAAGLCDEQMLIQRGFLDILVTHLPLHSPVLHSANPADFELLMRAAVGVVTRRDMSLNRRLWAWLLGPDPTTDVEADSDDIATDSPPPSASHPSSLATRAAYFQENGKSTLVRALLSMINEERVDLTVAERARPFRICSSLMDRWEIASSIDRDIFLPIIENVRKFQEIASNKAEFSEVLRSASVFFDSLDPGLIFAFLGDLLEQGIPLVRSEARIPQSLVPEPTSSCAGPTYTDVPSPQEDARRLDGVKLAAFVVNNFNVREEEMLTVHAPLIVASTLCLAQSRSYAQNDKSVPVDTMEEAIAVVYSLVDLIPSRAYPEIKTDRLEVGDNMEISRDIISWYRDHNGNIEEKPAPLKPEQVESIIIKVACNAFKTSLQWPNNVNIVVRRSQLVTLILSKVQVNASMADELINLKTTIKNVLDTNHNIPYPTFQAMMAYWAQHQRLPADFLRGGGSGHPSIMVPAFVKHAWSYLAAGDPKYHVETVRMLWLLQSVLGTDNRDIEAALCGLIIENDKNGSFAARPPDSGRSFSVLWSHTLQDHASERRSSRASTAGLVHLAKIGAGANRLAGAENFHVMLMQPLMLMLDSLLDERTQLYMTTKAWLNNTIGLDRLLFLFVLKFAELPFLRNSGPILTATGQQESEISEDDDLDMCLYLVRTLSNTLRAGPALLWILISTSNVNDASTFGSVSGIADRDDISMQEFFVTVCMRCISRHRIPEDPVLQERASQLCRITLTLLSQLLGSEQAEPLAEMKLEDALISRLEQSLDGPDPYIQVLLLEVILLSLKLRAKAMANTPESPMEDRRLLAPEPGVVRRPSSSGAMSINAPPLTPTLKILSIVHSAPAPPPALIKCIQAGLGSQNSRPVLDSWIGFLSACLPLYEDSIFQVLIPLVETFCTQISESFQSLRALYSSSHVGVPIVSNGPESTLISLINGLEDVLSTAHAQLLVEEKQVAANKSPDQPQGFFGNMVSGVFTMDAQHGRSATANDRLTVYLAFQDAVRVCFRIWSWGQGNDASRLDQSSTASFAYTSLRMRNRARRLLEQLFAAETLECLETVIEIWRKAYDTPMVVNKPTLPHNQVAINGQQVITLFPALDGSRPKNTMPALFDAIYSRTNPSALEVSRKSTLTISLLDVDLAMFLNEYAHSLDDDAMDEIWTDCMTFIKDILANPFPHRQILPLLMEFAATLSEKVENTNFGELRKMRRELGDVFLRLLTAIFTTRPLTYTEPVSATEHTANGALPTPSAKAEDVVGILADIVPKLPKILIETDRTLTAVSTISTNVFQPLLRSKFFPEGVTPSTLRLFKELARVPQNQKNWRKDIGDAFNDQRFFANDLALVESDWMPLLKQWVHADKDRMPELLTRITPPTTAGIVFGVGATSARLDADRKTQLNLRRIASLILASGEDAFVGDLESIAVKLTELLAATATSSPSSATRADIYMVIRALVLCTGAIHLAILWPVVTNELLAALTSVVSADGTAAAETYPATAIMQACKLLDLLLCVAPDDFQLHQWLFITDTIDAIYRPSGYIPVALADELAEDLGQVSLGGSNGTKTFGMEKLTKSHKKRPLIGDGGISDDLVETRGELVGKVVQPFFGHLSIYAFESTYAMKPLDREFCISAVLKDVFDERTIVKTL